MTPKLICILGAESTGKTTLARQLAVHFDCPWVPEYLRAFCDERGRTPYRDEQALILETQHVHELVAAAKARAAAQEKASLAPPSSMRRRLSSKRGFSLGRFTACSSPSASSALRLR